jgi:GGDEF domain-containing protein
MSSKPQYSHNGVRDDLTHCTAPPLFYAHVDRMIAGSLRRSSPFSLIAFTLSDEATDENVIALAHSIAISMRQEDLCGRLGTNQFTVALTGDLQAGAELCKRVQESFPHLLSMQVAQYESEESSLGLFYRLDTLYEKQMELEGRERQV